MRLLKHQILVLLLCAFFVLMGSFYVVLGWQMKDHDVVAAQIKVQADLAICEEIIDTKYPGSWSVQDGELYKGPVKISFNNNIADHLSRLTGDTVTVFLGEMPVVTSELSSNGEPVLGGKASANVAQTVLQNGQMYLGREDNGDRWNQVGYFPLRAESDKIIGMFCVRISQSYDQSFFTRSLITMATLGLVLTVLIVFLTLRSLRKAIIYPLQNIMSGAQEVATEQLMQSINVSSAKEIKELKDVFNQMVDQIQVLTGEINQVTHSNLKNESLDNNEIHNVMELMRGNKTMTELTTDYTVATKPNPEFSMESPWYSGDEGLPKGLSKVTLEHIVQFLQATRRPLSAEEVAEGVKLTRVTVRHYLEFLEQRRVLKSELRYGTGGRPVKLFILL
ncbi:cache domain-containing protein [Desulfosporosinus sp. BG]|uniref:cache domain-containing protein n=1 Tax=Desulfosporosinus sp. BG TaxID=1633135 RepID=UPI00083B6D52|nr:cache domain-containing protein [Desulfosporosinus sp. BG]ODA39629.1 methyl-accepting chemotaxis protein [Desulfosporosinus sp. BG]